MFSDFELIVTKVSNWSIVSDILRAVNHQNIDTFSIDFVQR